MPWSSKRRAGVAVRLLLVTVAALAVVAPAAHAAPPAKTDVVLVFDTTGSMDDAIAGAQEQVRSVMDRLTERLPDVQFALGAVRDYPFEPYGDPGDLPWEVVQGLTADRTRMQEAVDGLEADGGGDGPESYGRALAEAEEGGGIGWRPGARRVAVVVADNMPHDDDLNEGVPEDVQTETGTYDTEVDPGRDETVGTADDVDWQATLRRLNDRGLPLMLVLYQGSSDRLGYWKHWAGLTGGEAVMGDDSDSAVLADRLVTLAEKGATKDLGPCATAGDERGTDGICRTQPVVFLPGLMGSEIWCGDRQLWFEYRLGSGIDDEGLKLAADGRSPATPTNACNAAAAPREGQLLNSVLSKDVYGDTAKRFIDRFGLRYTSFAYDWRRSPAEAVPALDALVDRLRADNGGVRVRIVAHSMGGLVTRTYVDDPARAAKVSHVVTVGTPYWGSPKTLMPLARGDTDTAWGLGLDTLLGNGEVKGMTSNFPGIYSLMPSEAWHRFVGDWLKMDDQDRRKPLAGPPATAEGMRKQWPHVNTALYGQATVAHRAIDGFRTNGVKWLAIVGAGRPTIAGVRFDENLLRRDTYDWTYGNGDSTVPLFSAAQGSPASPPLGEPVRRQYRCGVDHGRLTADPQIWEAAAAFITDGGTTANALSDAPCAAEGDEVTLRAVPTGGRRARAASTGALSVRLSAGGPPLKVSEAEAAGLVQVVESDPDEVVLLVPRGQPVNVTARGRQLTVATRALVDSTAAPAQVVGPTDAPLALTTGPAPVVTRGGRPLRARPADVVPPRTTLRVRRRGGGAVLRFAARDDRRVRMTLVKVGQRSAVRLTGSTLRIARLTRRGVLVRFQSVDVFGNTERVTTRRVRAARRG